MRSLATTVRRLVTVGGTVLALVLVSVFASPAASAESASDYTGTSPQGGYGTGYWDNSSSSERYIEACDFGEPDGRRTVAILVVDGVAYEAHAAAGTGVCTGAAWVSGLRTGAPYSFRVCLRNGSGGSNVYCSGWSYGTVY